MAIQMQWEYLLKFLNHRLGVLDKKVILSHFYWWLLCTYW